MSLPHFFLEKQVLSGKPEDVFPLGLSPDDAKHARVLRLAPGERLSVVDARGERFVCKIHSFEAPKDMLVSIEGRKEVPARPSVCLVQGLAKGDKMDDIVRHATEVGVDAFVPFTSSRSIVRLDEKKADSRRSRWQAIAKSAAMQSCRSSIPTVEKPHTFKQLCVLLSSFSIVLVCWEEAASTDRLAAALASLPEARFSADGEKTRIAVVVGPEGGLSEAEADMLLACNGNAHLVTLGPSILRTETAGLVAPALVLYELER